MLVIIFHLKRLRSFPQFRDIAVIPFHPSYGRFSSRETGSRDVRMATKWIESRDGKNANDNYYEQDKRARRPLLSGAYRERLMRESER